ncbi:MAG TPA: AAA family ATPase [Bryobacteraceae bacterium]|nr:AAA family ATPase [Bryobacteraceae bacterium]
MTKEPFAMTPDPAFLFLTGAHREALAGLSYAVLGGKGFVVLTGDAGTGKTTLLTKMLRSIPPSRAAFSVVLNPMLSPDEFLEMALLDFGIRSVPASKAQRLILLREYLSDARKQGKISVLVVDEAHKLSPSVLEEIRLLSNFELADTKLLQIVLAGQNELATVLNREDLRQLKQRISVRLTLPALSRTDVEHYVQHRWTKAGGQTHPFNHEAVGQIAHWSMGIPRLVNVLCDNGLVLAFGEGTKVVTAQHVAEVAADLELRERPVKRAPAARPIARAAVSAGDGADGQPAVGSLPTIERYTPETSKPSRLARWATKLRLGEVRQS